MVRVFGWIVSGEQQALRLGKGGDKVPVQIAPGLERGWSSERGLDSWRVGGSEVRNAATILAEQDVI